MKETKQTKKQKIIKFLGISSVIVSLLLSSMALYYTGDIDDLESGSDGETSLFRTGLLYGTHGCENGGFSLQTGIDSNGDGVLGDSEVSEIKNICNGAEGPPGPMGNKGNHGENGTDGSDGINGSDGVIGVSSFIESFTGEHGPCPNAAIIEMGNNSTSGIVDSSIKICFENLTSGRFTDIEENAVNSFSSGCNGGLAQGELFIFAAAKNGNCLLYKLERGVTTLLSADTNFSPGSLLGFVSHENRTWFDANDGSGTQLWSSDGQSLWKETNLTTPIQQGDRMLVIGGELYLSYQSGMITFAESDIFQQGTISNLTSANEKIIYNTGGSIYLDGNFWNGEIHSFATYSDGYYWFIATSDGFGAQLHRANDLGMERMTDNLANSAGQIISPTAIGESIVFDSNGLFAFDISSSTASELNSSISNIPQDSDFIVHENKIWFQCGIVGIGYELCVSDGNDAWLYSDHVQGMDSSHPDHLTIVGENLVMLIDDPTYGGQLVMLGEDSLDILWDHSDSDFEAGIHGEIWADDHWLYFIADDANFGLEMYGWAHGQLSDDWIIIH